MKLMLIVIMIICCLMNTSCTKSKSIGIIGGADGPTSILVSSRNGESQKKSIRMIKVDGKLYYDSGIISDVSERCGTLDGDLTRVGKEFEIPINNNECNFEGAEGYQNATSITKEVLIDGDWIIFKQFDDPELDMSIYKYCFYIKGRMPNAVNDSEIVVLTEDINYTFDKHCEKLLSSQYSSNVSATTFRIYGD